MSIENVWYVLMTVAGPQNQEKVSWQMHESNRHYWNGWQAQNLSESDRRSMEGELRLAPGALSLSADEYAEIEKALIRRAGIGEPVSEKSPLIKRVGPTPKDVIDLSAFDIEHDLLCRGYIFLNEVLFRGSKFTGFFDCQNAVFYSKFWMQGATAFEYVDFTDCTFKKGCSFNYTNFHGATIFNRASISEGASFVGVEFLRETDFSGVKFHSAVTFERSIHHRNSIFMNTEFWGPLSFSRSTLKAELQFEGSRFQARTNFTFLNFQDSSARMPTFYNSKLHENTDWYGIIWPIVPLDQKELRDYCRACERLKLLMDEKNKFSDEHFFLRMELAAREKLERRILPKAFYALFRVVSNYGWSISNPLYIIISLWIGGAALIGLTEWYSACFEFEGYNCMNDGDQAKFPERHLNIGQALALSFSNIFAFLGLSLHVMKDEVNSLTSLSEVILMLQAFIGPVLLFVLAVGIRNRFRMK